MQWTESIDVAAPLAQVQDAVADQHRLMAWSAWQEATGYTCTVDGDGRSVGSAIVFRDSRGVEQGRQTLTRVSPERVEHRLLNRGPGGRDIRPEVDFRLEALDARRTRVHLDFRATPPLPPVLRQLVELVMARKVRALHVKDLQQLKQHVESGDERAA